MNNTVHYVYQKKEGRAYVDKYICTDALQVHEDLAHELISKKINECRWIKSIKRTPLYNGFQKIIIQYDNDSRRVYTVTDH